MLSMLSYKKRWKIIDDEILHNKGNSLYLEKRINEIMRHRYRFKEIDTRSTYIYEKMQMLLKKKVYMRTWNNVHYVREQWYINVFELHKKLDDIIRQYHLPYKNSSLYTSAEKEYMQKLESRVP